MQELISFGRKAKGFDLREKIKFILFAAGVKPNAYLILKCDVNNLEEKYQLESLLKEYRFPFHVSKARSYEEVEKVKGNTSYWRIKGVWYAYDLFSSYQWFKRFKRYLHLVKKKHALADRIGGEIYGYPACDIEEFIKEKNPFYLKKNYSYYQYYGKLRQLDRKFPFVFHRAHALDCQETKKLNQLYEKTIKSLAPKVYGEYKKKKEFLTKLLVCGESDISHQGKSIWPKKDGHEYELFSLSPFKGKYFFISYLTRKKFPAGTVLKARVIFQYNFADLKNVRVVGFKKDFHHRRKILTKI